ncbi:hypothetical protein Ddc_04754 [Ditylenchus destructor]|nr:hypothetical protein Ddc_04754 [Ditylenchus destructor]
MRLTSLLCGVPKYRTPKAKIMTRKFHQPYQYQQVENIVECSTCKTPRLITTICLKCYQDVRIQTNKIKQQMMNYNPYLGERQTPVHNRHNVHQMSEKTEDASNSDDVDRNN